MTADRTTRRPAPRVAARHALVVVLLTSLVAAGCAADPEPVAATRTPTASPTAAAQEPVPDVPLQPATLGAQPAADARRPVDLVIPDRAIQVPVDPVGVAEDGQMEIPPLAERAGWYRFGSSPGDPAGTAVVAAHVDSVASAGLGPFARLGDVEPGDAVDVTLDDGTVVRYAVVDVVRVPKVEAVWDEVFVRDGPPRLVLVTCGGVFQRDVGHYTDNVIVTAEPVGA
ncbi:class F sortase [Cellulomonas sp. NPDC055163]